MDEGSGAVKRIETARRIVPANAGGHTFVVLEVEPFSG
jgi:hypothetical protein